MSHALSAGRTLSRPLSASVCGKYDIPSRRPYERIAEDLISACRKHVVVATGSSPFKVRDNQRPERTMSGVRKPPPESSVPGKNLPRGSRRNQLRRGTWESAGAWRGLFEPSSAMHFTERERAPQTFSSPAAPYHDNPPPGRKTHIHTPPTRPLAVPAASSPA